MTYITKNLFNNSSDECKIFVEPSKENMVVRHVKHHKLPGRRIKQFIKLD